MVVDRILKSDSPPSSEPGAIILETERLVLRRAITSDALAMATAGNYPEVTFNMRDRFPSPYTVADAEHYIANFCGPDPAHYPKSLSIFIKPCTADNSSSEPRFIGGIGIVPGGDVNYRSWEMGYWITPSEWRKGYATEVVTRFVSWCFETWLKLNRIEAEVYGRNVGSAGVLKKCGFVMEGVKRGAVEKHGLVLDEVFFSVIRSDLERS